MSALPMPHSPAAYPAFDDGVVFDPARHLALEFPERKWTLAEFGYSEEAIAQCASPVAVTSPFRILSDQGVADLHDLATRLKSVCSKIEGNRTPQHLAGGVYRSKFLRDLCHCPQLLAHMSAIAGTELLPHAMPSQQIYINYAPDDVSKAVDAWHYDGIGFDYVIMASDPAKLVGGDFEYFTGTRDEIAAAHGMKVHEVRYGITADLPEERVIRVRFPAAGYAIFQQGSMVVHRAARLEQPGDRITLVPGLVAADSAAPDPTALHDMPHYNEPGIFAELARHSAARSRDRLGQLIDSLDIDSDAEQARLALTRAIEEAQATIRYLDGQREP